MTQSDLWIVIIGGRHIWFLPLQWDCDVHFPLSLDFAFIWCSFDMKWRKIFPGDLIVHSKMFLIRRFKTDTQQMERCNSESIAVGNNEYRPTFNDNDNKLEYHASFGECVSRYD